MNIQELSLSLLLLFICGVACQPQYPQGKVLYDFHCAGCHIDDGSGLGYVYPPLTKNDFLLNNFDEIPCYIIYGLEGEIVVNDTIFDNAMPAIKSLSPVEIANILNYMNTEFEYDLPPIQLQDVMDNLSGCD